VFIAIALVCIGIAIGFAMRGLWMVLPFAGLEVLALGFALYYCSHRSAYIEVLRIENNTLYIEKGRYKPEEKHEFNLAWARVHIRKAKHGNHPPRITIGSHGKEIEVGASLVEEERIKLARDIQKAINEYCKISAETGFRFLPISS
jgi:uncharacterized membrane protein